MPATRRARPAPPFGWGALHDLPFVKASLNLSTGTLIRVSIIGLAQAVALLRGQGLDVMPWALLVLVLDLVAGQLCAVSAPLRRRRKSFVVVLASAVGAGAGLWATNSPSPGAYALLLVPAYRAGEVFGRRAALVVVVVSAVVASAGTGYRHPLDAAFVVNGIQWAGLALMFGILGAWSTFLRDAHVPVDQSTQAAREAAVLLRRLDSLAASLDGGFDAPASAELTLDAVDAVVRSTRRGVLVGSGKESAVPLALRGADRIPWDDPTVADSVLGTVWRTGRPQAGRRFVGVEERALMAVALHDPTGARMGVLVLDRPAAFPFSARDIAAVTEVADVHSVNLDVALTFAALRERAGYEERERLSREMHDGIAQELVALGYGIDLVRRQAAIEAPDLAQRLVHVRADLTEMLGDLRVNISDMRVAVRPDRGLGAIVGDRVQRFGATTGMPVVLRLNDSGYRLPAHIETLIYRLVLTVLADASHALGTTWLDLTLDVSAPDALLRITHDGRTALSSADFESHPLTGLGARIVIEPRVRTGVVVQMHLRHQGGEHASLTAERIPQRSC